MFERWRTPTGRAALGAMIGGPVGVVTALATGGPLVAIAALAVAAGALVGALTATGEDLREAAIDAILPIGAWLVGAAIAWVVLATQAQRLPLIVQANPQPSALVAAILGGTIAVVLMIARLGKRAE